MSSSYKRVKIKSFPQLEDRDTPEAKFWKRFKDPVIDKQPSSVSHISFSQTKPYDFLVTSGARVVVYDGLQCRARRTITRFKDVARSAEFRPDGKLILAGGEESLVRLFDAASRDVLRTFRGHKGPVRSCRFSRDKVHVLSASDDRSVKYWDISEDKPLCDVTVHEDYVRCSAGSPQNAQVWATGSYDHTARIWDVRAPGEGGMESVMKLTHGTPIETMLWLPGGAALLTAGGNEIKVWDIVGGGQLLHTFSAHQKTITSLTLDGTGTRLLSGGLDCHLKVYDLNTYEVTHGIKYTAPILSVACSPDNTRLAVGLSDGLLSVRRRDVKAQEAAAEVRVSKMLRGGSYKYFMRGASAKPERDDVRVETTRKVKLRPFDKFLKQFQYRRALDAALKTSDPVTVVSVFEELNQRNGLEIALSGRDEDALQPVVAFLLRYSTHPRYASTLLDVSSTVFDLYTQVIGQSPAIDELLLRFRNKIQDEISLERDLMSLLGVMDLLMASNTSTPQLPLLSRKKTVAAPSETEATQSTAVPAEAAANEESAPVTPQSSKQAKRTPSSKKSTSKKTPKSTGKTPKSKKKQKQ